MKRRNVLKGVGAASATTIAAPAIAQDVKTLTMVTSWPRNFPALGRAARRFSARLETASGGRYKVKLFPGGELVHPLECNDAVEKGLADLYHSTDYYYQDKIKAYAFYAAVPFGFRPDEVNAWIYHGGGQDLWDEVGAQFGIKHLMCGNRGSQMGGWFKKPMTSLDDFQGLKMRIPGLGGDVIDAIGGTSVTLAVSDILTALQSGAVDATEWVGPWSDLAFGFYRAVKHYHFPGFHEPGTINSLGLRKTLWESFSNADRELFKACAAAENSYALAEVNANNAQAVNTLVSKHGVTLHEFPDDVFAAMGAASKDVLAAAGNADPLTKKVYESFMNFRKIAVGWSKLSDQTYMVKRELVPF